MRKSNQPGYMSFATSGPDSRTTQVFINYGNNQNLDEMQFAPFGKVEAGGMQTVNAINSEYKEKPAQGKIQEFGNKYLDDVHPRLSKIISATIIEDHSESFVELGPGLDL